MKISFNSLKLNKLLVNGMFDRFYIRKKMFRDGKVDSLWGKV